MSSVGKGVGGSTGELVGVVVVGVPVTGGLVWKIGGAEGRNVGSSLIGAVGNGVKSCLLYTSPSPRDS